MAVDPNIKNKATNIRNEIYGKDVREALASGLEAMSEDVVDNKNRQDSVEDRFQDVIDGTTDKDVISAPEILDARQGHSNLGQNLLSMKQDLQQKADQAFVDSQFATIVSGAPKGTYTDLASLQSAYPNGVEGIFLVLSDGHWYYWNSTTTAWTDGGVYQSAGGDWLQAMTEENQEWGI